MQDEYFGIGSIDSLADVVSRNHPKSLLLVTGRKSFELCGVKDKIDASLEGLQVVRFFDFGVNPKIEDIKKGIALFQRENIDMIVAVGGGSVIDIAKSINLLAMQIGTPEQYIKKEKQIEHSGKVMVAIPTTAGTGSEATSFAVVYIGNAKFSLEHKYVLPNYAIVDPSLTFCLPPYITACTGMDALAQAIESYWAVGSTDESKRFAEEAIKLTWNNLERAVNGGDQEARIAMSKGSNLAGKAINIAKTTACHAISYPITSYFNVPHGHAVSLTLGEMLEYNSHVFDTDCLDERGVRYVQKTMAEIVCLIAASDATGAQERIQALMAKIGLATTFGKLSITQDNLETIVRHGFNPDRVKNNPRLLTKEVLRNMLVRLL